MTDHQPNHVADRPEFGSVERYAETIRGNSRDGHDVYVAALAIVEVVAEDSVVYGDAERAARVRNVVAAAHLVLDELPGGAR